MPNFTLITNPSNELITDSKEIFKAIKRQNEDFFQGRSFSKMFDRRTKLVIENVEIRKNGRQGFPVNKSKPEDTYNVICWSGGFSKELDEVFYLEDIVYIEVEKDD